MSCSILAGFNHFGAILIAEAGGIKPLNIRMDIYVHFCLVFHILVNIRSGSYPFYDSTKPK